MFIVVVYGRPDHQMTVMSIEGIVYSEQEFNSYLDVAFKGMRKNSERCINQFGKLSISYHDSTSMIGTIVAMQKIDELVQNYKVILPNGKG